MIAEKSSRVHRGVRGFYNRRGYPISKFIDTPVKADITYFLMKPLEWIFLGFLYFFDVNPESRIAVQHTVDKVLDRKD